MDRFVFGRLAGRPIAEASTQYLRRVVAHPDRAVGDQVDIVRVAQLELEERRARRRWRLGR